MEVLSSSKPVPGFQGGTVRHTTVTKMEKIRHGFGHFSSYTFYTIYVKDVRSVVEFAAVVWSSSLTKGL